ncbi:MAG: hypothetical protein ACYTA3_02285 [Planctomycetota bacterium]|jgi:hypothetical protein
MFVNNFRTRYDVKVVSIEDYVYGFSTTYILEYEDGTFERINYMDAKSEAEAEEFKKNNSDSV